jgi:hypothetical protein
MDKFYFSSQPWFLEMTVRGGAKTKNREDTKLIIGIDE